MIVAPEGTNRWERRADLCYWAVLDEPCPRRPTRRHRQRLDFAFEGELPLPIERVQPAYAPIDAQRTLACATAREKADEAIGDGVLVLRPASAPAFVLEACGESLDPTRDINLLVHDCTPCAVRRSRARLHAAAALLIGSATVLLLLGMEHRIRALSEVWADLMLQKQAVLEIALPEADVADELAMLAELRRLERSRSPDGPARSNRVGEDVTPALADALASWPPELFARTRRLTASASQIQLIAEIDAIERAELLSQALAEDDRWTAQVPRAESQRGAFLATITLTAGASP
ncbi:MAG: hypothetical protein AAFX79_00020 [Planctomycetota bacterium]